MAFLTGIAGTGTGQYFTDENSQPYLVRFDTVWGLVVKAGNSGGATTWQSDMDNYCSARAGQGFNGFLVTTTSTTQITGANTDGSTWDGVAPFTSPGVLNDTFWQRVDYLLASAASQGMTVVLNVMFRYAFSTSGGPLDGWTDAQYQNYGAALGGRYAATPNLVWEFGDDNLGDADDHRYTACLTGIRGAGDTHLVSIENNWEGDSRRTIDGSVTYAWGTANAQFNWVYGYNAGYDGVEAAYTESSPLLVCRMDGWYDNQAAQTESTQLFMRKLLWWVLSSGSRGYQYGNNDLWYWPTGVIAGSLLTGGGSYQLASAQQTILSTFASFTGWHKLVPDTSSALVTAGRGTHVTHFAPGTGSTYTGGNTYVSASKTADGTLAVIYLPNAASAITVNASGLATGYGAKWIDPVNGAQTAATIASTYSHAGANSAGDPDWVLLLGVPPYATWAVQ